MAFQFSRCWLFVLALASLGGCAGYPSSADSAVNQVAARGWQQRRHATAGFAMVSWHRLPVDAEEVLVVVEGDGRAWRTRRRPSADPTPADPVGLRLALASGAPAVIYIARPCQFLEALPEAGCDLRWWTSHRYATEVVAATSKVIDTLLADRVRPARLTLLGWSGGGVIATLLAASRTDVDLLVSVAANLDTEAWVAHHGVSPLTGSDTPRRHLRALAGTPQLHLGGADDDVAPPALNRDLLAAIGPVASQQVLPGQGHRCCWVSVWPAPLCAATAARGITRVPGCEGTLSPPPEPAMPPESTE